MAHRTNSQVLGATLLGGMVGAGLALLFAPRSGKETRDHIRDNVRQMQEDAHHQLDRAKSKVRKGMDDAKDLKNRLAEAAHNTGQQAKAGINELKEDTKAKSRRESAVLSAWEEEV